MDTSTVFLTGMAATAVICLAVIAYLKASLSRILTDICGTEARARFWVTFSNILLILTPILFAIFYQPQVSERPAVFFEVVRQLKWGLSGLVLTVAMLGVMIKGYIPKPR